MFQPGGCAPLTGADVCKRVFCYTLSKAKGGLASERVPFVCVYFAFFYSNPSSDNLYNPYVPTPNV